jgi:undecaprenyl diphosphate synthase
MTSRVDFFLEQKALPYILVVMTTIVFCMVVGAIIGPIKSFVAQRTLSAASAIAIASKSIGSTSSHSNSNDNYSSNSSKIDISKAENNENNSIDLENDASILTKRPSKLPVHIAVIMDGNRRYGVAKQADPLHGHWRGGEVLADLVNWCVADGIKILTVFAFSSENWNRDPVEVSALMGIIVKYAERMQEESIKKNVKVRVISTDTEKLSADVKKAIFSLEESSKHCTGLLVNICLSYGARSEIVHACKSIAKSVEEGKLDSSSIDESLVNRSMLTGDIPDPDIMIRTSGELRISNFLLWQLAYSELFFIDKLWPEITFTDFRRVLWSYSARKRRFGS